jgi:VIT1/CCC1 family predicted Fe2+/Mn2+ transporter
MYRPKKETYFVQRMGCLRAAVMGANDGIISTAGLIVGVASAAAQAEAILVAGVAGLVRGAMSMAAGEYVSVSSQSDTERGDLVRESLELKQDPAFEREELAQIYVHRGLELPLARKVAQQLMAKDVMPVHIGTVGNRSRLCPFAGPPPVRPPPR